jgi:enediyne biosynthesis protein E4
MMRWGYLIPVLLLAACSGKPKNEADLTKPLFETLTPEQTGIQFSNNLTFSDSVHIFLDQYLFNGGGVAAGDINGDGLCDVLLTANQTGAKLYLNKGNFKFEDVTEKAGIRTAGWLTGATMTDVNNDGKLDIFICRSGNQLPANLDAAKLQNYLFINKGDGTFEERATEYGLTGREYSSHGTFFDMDNDGDLDLYVANHPFNWAINMDKPFNRLENYNDTFTDRLYENTGNGFKDITHKAGIACYSFGLAVTAGDLNLDGFTDLYICNDYDYPDFVWINNGNGTFTDRREEMFRHTSFYSMGADIADMNHDGLPDVITLDMLPPDNYRKKTQVGPLNWDRYSMRVRNGYGEQFMRNTLQLNSGRNTFNDHAFLWGMAETDWSWSPLAADFNNDGFNDLYVSNGYYRDYNDLDYVNYKAEMFRRLNIDTYKGFKEGYFLKFANEMPAKPLRNFMFSSNGAQGFNDVSAIYGLDHSGYSGAAAYADLDNDGDLDLIVNNLGEPVSVYRNTTRQVLTSHNWLRLQFHGVNGNKLGIGCKVLAETPSNKTYYELTLSHGYQSSSEPILHIGLGNTSALQKLTVIWPGGKMQVLEFVEGGQELILNEKDALLDAGDQQAFFRPKKELNIEEITAKTGVNFLHTEDPRFIDFKNEPLIPRKQSRRGPALAVGDVNGDKLEDFFIGNGGGSKGGSLYIQNASGTFTEKPGPWKRSNSSEQTGAVLFDADGDGDLDLYVCSGSNEYPEGSEQYLDHLYINDGKGNFSEPTGLIPALRSPKNCVAAADIDGDGDMDLFIGGAVIPDRYPLPSASYILRNDNGKFTEATQALAPGIEKAGIVTDAAFADLNADKKPDLIVCGEWMPVMVWENGGGKLSDQSQQYGVSGSGGWWNCISLGDLDGDGDIDVVLGNQGMNSQVRPEPGQPASIAAADFDNNGRLDAVCSYYIQGQQTHWHPYDELTAQMVGFMRKRFIKYADFAAHNAEALFGDQYRSAYKRQAETFRNAILWNEKGRFRMEALPFEAQAGCVNGIILSDVNGDGKTDILLNGNNYGNKAEWGKDDALNGLVLLNQGAGKWNILNEARSGYYTPGNTRRSRLIQTARGPVALVSRSDGVLSLMQLL